MMRLRSRADKVAHAAISARLRLQPVHSRDFSSTTQTFTQGVSIADRVLMPACILDSLPKSMWVSNLFIAQAKFYCREAKLAR